MKALLAPLLLLGCGQSARDELKLQKIDPLASLWLGCDAILAKPVIGKKPTMKVQAQAKLLAKATQVAVDYPYSGGEDDQERAIRILTRIPNRLTLELNEWGKIYKATCG